MYAELLAALLQMANQPTYDAINRGATYGAMRGIDDYFDENLGTKFGPNVGAQKGAAAAYRAQNNIPYNPLPDRDYGAYIGAVKGRNAALYGNTQGPY